MREKLQTLPLTQLRELAKAQGLKGVTTLKKAEIIDRLCEIAGGKAADKDLAGMDAAGAEGGGVHNIIPSEPLAAAEEKKTDEKPSETIDKEPRILKKNTREEKREEAPRRDTNRYRDDSRKRDYQPRGDYQQRSDNQSRSDYQQRGDNQSRGDYQQRGDNQSRGDYQQRGDNQSRGDYQQRGESQSRGDYQQRGESQSRGDYQQRGESQSRGDYQQRAENQTRGEYQSRNEEGKTDFQELDSGIEADGILEVMPDGFGFIRCENFLPGENDVYVAPSQIRRFNLKTGDIVRGSRRVKTATEKFAALLYINTVNGYPTNVVERRPNFENLTPIFPNSRLHLEMPGTRNTTAMRVMDLLSPIGKGQRGMIVSPPKAGKTTLLKQVARAVTANHPEMHLIILLIDERPEEVTDIREAITGPNVEVIYSTFDELPDRHKRVSEMVIERAKRLVEHGRDVMILLDSITRLARAYNLVVPPSGRTLSGGLDPAALHMPKRFFGAARNMRENGSLTILATALIDTGSRMDDVIYEEFKGTGNMEIVLDRKLSEKRIFPAIDILKSGTRRDDLLLTQEESEAVDIIHKATNTQKPEESVERILDLFAKTRNNQEFVDITRKRRFF
ncbi:transcription termination factor Rho [[Clostridium] symbiosum]|uniref:transcription termination factor Rho n=5 Tax=Clostridia TaxID=186801 RepID=UPI0012326E4E|nr:transcription termination factor Rho [[Clostridium] symbiosum]KAA6140260.1 transcription termination factor Rho [[Clostridium] symbiosum]MBS6221845.1 transcription termination factor Rho [[Clostridium] symbiosum]